MGYRSDVRCLIYGPQDKIDALVTKHRLLGHKQGINSFEEELTFGSFYRTLFDDEATAAAGADPDNGRSQYITKDVLYGLIDLDCQDVKWYDDYEDVKWWTAFMEEARDEWELCVEFVRIGEDRDDNEFDSHIPDDGDSYLGISRSITCDEIEKIKPPES